jgi:hypothetical protein
VSLQHHFRHPIRPSQQSTPLVSASVLIDRLSLLHSSATHSARIYSITSQHPLFPGAPNPSLCSARIPILMYHLMFVFDAQHTSQHLIFSPSLCACPQFGFYFAICHSSQSYASWLIFDIHPAARYSPSARELYLFTRHPSRHRVSIPTLGVDSSPWSLGSHCITSHDHYPFDRMCSFCYFAPISSLCSHLIPSHIRTSLIWRRLA